jgi:hypothetical protein
MEMKYLTPERSTLIYEVCSYTYIYVYVHIQIHIYIYSDIETKYPSSDEDFLQTNTCEC